MHCDAPGTNKYRSYRHCCPPAGPEPTGSVPTSFTPDVIVKDEANACASNRTSPTPAVHIHDDQVTSSSSDEHTPVATLPRRDSVMEHHAELPCAGKLKDMYLVLSLQAS
jgi:hypothetical protein